MALAGGRARPGAHAISRVVNAPTGGGALRLLARELFPPPSYMRVLASRPDAGRRQLAAAYARRLARGVCNAPGAIREVLRARHLNRRS